MALSTSFRSSDDFAPALPPEAPFAVIDIDAPLAEARILAVAGGFARLTGHSEEAALSGALSLADLIHPADVPRLGRMIAGLDTETLAAATSHGGAQRLGCFRQRNGDGAASWLRLDISLCGHARLAEDAGDPPAGRPCRRLYLWDASQEMEGIAAGGTLADGVFDAIEGPLALVALDGRFLRANIAFLNALDYSHDALLELPCESVVHPEDWEALITASRALRDGSEARIRLTVRGLDRSGRRVPMETVLTLVGPPGGSAECLLLQAIPISPGAASTGETHGPGTGATTENGTDADTQPSDAAALDAPFRRVLEALPDGVAVVVGDEILYANPAMLALAGEEEDEDGTGDGNRLLGKSLESLLTPAYRTACRARLRGGGEPWEMTGRMLLRDKRTLPVILHGNTARRSSDDSAPSVCVVTIQAVQTGGVMPLQDRLYAVLEQMPISVLITDTQGLIEYVNPTFLKSKGYAADEVLGLTPRILKSGQMDSRVYAQLWTDLKSGRVWRGEFENRRKDGSLLWERTTVTPLRDEHGVVTHYMAVNEDVTKRKAAETRVWHQANHDTLTDLPNRVLFQDRLAQAVAWARRRHNQVAVLFIDLDHFKTVNDTLGHGVGDELLRQTAGRLRECLRDTDTLARLGGDEFTIVLVHDGRDRDNALVAQRILEALRKPFLVGDGKEVLIGGSIGITLFPQDAQDVAGLVRNADTAMYRAKASGRNTFRFFTADMNTEIQAQIDMENDLRRAVRDMDLTVYYQPVVDSRTLQVMGAEALVRWPRSENTFVPPAQFIPIAEELGLIEEIGGWVLWNACTQARAWQEKLRPGFRMAVNVSWRQIKVPGFEERVREVLDGVGLAPEFLELEINESLLLNDPKGVAPVLAALDNLGVQLAVDNFGTSHSSIKHLRQYPFSILKLDRSCVADVLTSHEDAVLVETATSMARKLGLRVVAEGVETEEQLAFLRENYCDLIQGFLFGPPLPPDEIMKML